MASRGAEGLVLQRRNHREQAVLSFGLDDIAYLTSDEGAVALSEAAALPLTDRVGDIARLRRRFGDRTPVLVETVLLRRRAAAKLAELPGTEQWLFTDEALQQATAAVVALHRSKRLRDRVIHDVTCSVGAESAALHVSAARVVGSDIDPVRLAMAKHNLGGTVDLCRADALHPVTLDAVVVADPARRSSGRRRFDPRNYQPALDELIEAYRGRDLIVKCAPGVDFGAVGELGFDGEIEVTSYGGWVREACLWSAGLAEPGVSRRASMLDRDDHVTDAEPDDCQVRPVGRWIVDPDGAVVRAGLVRQFAARHGLWQLDRNIAYLSGDRLPDGIRGFEVIEQLAFDERRLRQVLTKLDCGSVEILIRGIEVDPDGLRRRMMLRGNVSLSVVVTRIGSGAAARGTAFVCRPSR